MWTRSCPRPLRDGGDTDGVERVSGRRTASIRSVILRSPRDAFVLSPLPSPFQRRACTLQALVCVLIISVQFLLMTSVVCRYTEAVHQTEDAMSSHCWYIPRSLAHIVTPSHTRRPDAPHLQASTHMQGNASKRPGAGGVEQWGGRGVARCMRGGAADAACRGRWAILNRCT